MFYILYYCREMQRNKRVVIFIIYSTTILISPLTEIENYIEERGGG